MSSNTLSESSIQCAICLSDSSDDFVTLPCDHFYHKKCISDNYIFEITRNNKTEYQCPACRQIITMDQMGVILHSPQNNTNTVHNSGAVYYGATMPIENTPLNPLQMHPQQQQKKCCERNTIIAIVIIFICSVLIFCTGVLPKII